MPKLTATALLHPSALTVVAVLALNHAVAAQTVLPNIPGIAPPACPEMTGERPWLNAAYPPECRALAAVGALTEDEKIFWGNLGAIIPQSEPIDETSPAVLRAREAEASAERKLGLPPLGRGGDGPNGIADMSGLFGAPPDARAMQVTAFPNVIALGATWDRDLASRFGAAMGEEFHAKGMTSNLGPTVNLIRSWHGGRSAESFSEDPFLMSELVVEELNAMQDKGVVAVLKHFVANNQEFSRVGAYPVMGGTDTIVSEKALEEIYFPAYRAAVQRANIGGIMCSYNQVNGEFACNSSTLLNKLFDWGFEGAIMPDAAYAMRDAVAAAAAGVTTATPVEEVEQGIKDGRVDAHHFDRKIYQTLVPRFRHGLYDAPPAGRYSNGAGDAQASTPEHIALAREIGGAAAVLLKNDHDTLPLNNARTIAVIGADASGEAVVMETGSPNVRVENLSTPIAAILARAGGDATVVYQRGNAGVRALPPVPASVLRTPSGEPGLQGTYYHTPWFWPGAVQRIDEQIDFKADPGIPPAPAGVLGMQKYDRGRGGPWSAQWRGTLLPPKSGDYVFSLSGAGTAELYLDGKLVTTVQRADFPASTVGMIALDANRPVTVQIKYHNASAILGHGIRLGWQVPDERLQHAVAAARQADVAVVFVGEQLGEGYDKHFFDLPGDQNAMIAAVAAANPRTVVVLHTSTAVAMPWLDEVAAVVQAWYPGQEAGTSISDVLFGDVNPSGRLPVTFPRNGQQGPTSNWLSYPGDGQTVVYDEGVFVGYRWFDANDEQPLFPFGHGLSYTAFTYSRLNISGSGDDRVVRFTLKNTGKRAGAEVAQLYIGVPSTAEEPPRQLKGFEKVLLQPGESKEVSIPLPDSLLRMFDAPSRKWRLFSGDYRIEIGASSRDIRLQQAFRIE
ncbi:MAG: glycoside hydrolase family 3 C-terminal domain-containing protein [Gammaproteobacteria bacterium]|nr:glycoside hydrolase family 3 C-terminal domain-containing protein [Gammaproteobacteria bacterium]